MRGRPVLCCPAFAVQRAGTAVPPHLPALKQAPEGAVPAPAAHYCCDGLTRPVLLTLQRTFLCGRAFFRKLAGDGRVKAAGTSLTAVVPDSLTNGLPLSGLPAPIMPRLIPMNAPGSGPAPGGQASAGAGASEHVTSKRGVSQRGARKLAPKHGGMIAWRLLAIAVLLPVVSLSIFRAVPAPWPTPVVQLLAFTPWLVVPSVLALGLALAGRRLWLTALAALVLAAQLFWLFPLDAGGPVPDSSVPGTRITVLNINSHFGEADAAEVVRLIREHGVELLAVQEHTQGLEDRLITEGLERLLPHKLSDPRDDASGSALYSAHPMEAMGVLPDTPFEMPTVRLALGKGGAASVLEVTNVHAFPPVAGRAAQWRSDLAALAGLTAAGTADAHRLLIGDFNATYDHAEFRAVLDGGVAPGSGVARGDGDGSNGGNAQDGVGARKLVDVGTAAGRRLLPTWPMDGLPLPGIAIDHLVTSPRIASSGYAVHRVPGTDHAAVLATLEIPAGG